MPSLNYSGVVQLVARQPLELVILVRVQAPEPHFLQSIVSEIAFSRFASRKPQSHAKVWGKVKFSLSRQADRRPGSRHSNNHCATWFLTDSSVGMRQRGIEIDRVSRFENVLFRSDV